MAILAGVVKRWLSIKEKEIDLPRDEAARKAARHAEQTERLEQRVRVLERIATDKGSTWPTRSSGCATAGHEQRRVRRRRQ